MFMENRYSNARLFLQILAMSAAGLMLMAWLIYQTATGRALGFCMFGLAFFLTILWLVQNRHMSTERFSVALTFSLAVGFCTMTLNDMALLNSQFPFPRDHWQVVEIEPKGEETATIVSVLCRSIRCNSLLSISVLVTTGMSLLNSSTKEKRRVGSRRKKRGKEEKG